MSTDQNNQARRTPTLSKSRFTAGLECLKRLYLESYHPELADPVDASLQARFDSGNEVGELARQAFPGGTLIAEEYFEHTQAVETTKALLAESPVPPLYEAAFISGGIRARVDILRQSGGNAFDLVELKSTTSAKDEHLPDVAIQLHVLGEAGIDVDRAYLMHVNNRYVYQGGPHDLTELFSQKDLTDDAKLFVRENVPGELVRMWEVLQRHTAPDIEVGDHCFKPYRCPFFGHCHQGESEHPVRQLPRLRASARAALAEKGIQDIGSIPSGFAGLNATQQRVRDCVVSGLPFVAPELAGALAALAYPVSFMDFETFSPAIPRFVGTRPYQAIPFQWSLHVRDADGRMSHHAFLNEDAADPRERFVVSLLEAAPERGSIVVYSGYEQRMLRELAQALPQYETSLMALCGRLFDLLPVVRANYYHPQFHGSFSLKSVTPALVPSLDYADLDIREGDLASNAYARMVSGAASESDWAKTRQDLLDYCERDTEALLGILDALQAETGEPARTPRLAQ